MIFVGLGVKNQLFLRKLIDFSLLVPQKLSVESSINNEVRQKSTFIYLVGILYIVIYI